MNAKSIFGFYRVSTQMIADLFSIYDSNFNKPESMEMNMFISIAVDSVWLIIVQYSMSTSPPLEQQAERHRTDLSVQWIGPILYDSLGHSIQRLFRCDDLWALRNSSSVVGVAVVAALNPWTHSILCIVTFDWHKSS